MRFDSEFGDSEAVEKTAGISCPQSIYPWGFQTSSAVVVESVP
jgi:hypothetical protein